MEMEMEMERVQLGYRVGRRRSGARIFPTLTTSTYAVQRSVFIPLYLHIYNLYELEV
jgi:hypothetical protein